MNARVHSSRWLVFCCVAIMLPSLAFAGARALLPGDGVLLDLQNEPPGEEGLYVGEVIAAGAPLRPGELLVSVNGRTVDALLADPKFSNLKARPGTPIHYLAERGSQLVEIEHRLQHPNVLAGLRANWSSYLFLIYMLAIAVMVFARRPELPAARGLLWAGSLIFASGLVFFLGLQPVDLLRGWPTVAFVWATVPLYALAMGAAAHFMLLFPQRRSWLEGRPWLIPLIYLGPWLLWLPLVASAWGPAGSSSARLLLSLRLSGVFSIVYPLLIVFVLLHGYLREFDARQRRQTRWLLWGATVALIPWITLSVLPSLLGAQPMLPQFAVGLIWLVIPTAFGIAIVRESLFDIDRIINRTLVYGSLSVVLVLIYLGVVVALQQGFEALTGQQSPLAIVLSTLLIAAAFHPLRRRIQTLIDRRFYRRRYDAAQSLNQLSLEMARRVELAELSQAVLNMVQVSLQPAFLSLWLRHTEPRQ